jgi:hypothetical protein
LGRWTPLKLTALNFPSYLVKTISSYLHNRTFEAPFQTAISTRHGMAWHRADWFPLCCSVCMSKTCLCHPATSSWHCTRMTRPSLPHPASQRCLLAT